MAVVLEEDLTFEQLVTLLRSKGKSDDDVAMVSRAFEYARIKHAPQKRKNGDNYITHPVSVALILAHMPVDTASVMAAILHDTLEDTDATPEEIRNQFGGDVLSIVEGVTKLGKFHFASGDADRQAENFRKMFIAMANDIRVILVKLTDRLHNMRTLHHLAPEKQVKIATETLEIFAPLANRMGMGNIRAELEDLSLKYLDPDKYQVIEHEIKSTQAEREATIKLVIDRIQAQLQDMDIENARIYGRVKNYFSIYKKMRSQEKNVNEIFDISAVRIIVNSEKECYEVLGTIHSAFTPIPGRFKDYIAMPKSNLYQSLHTTVIGPAGRPLEVQIRTHDMHRIAEYGIAAHWKYKESGGSVSSISEDEKKLSWLKQMLEMRDGADDARDFVNTVKLDLFRDEVFVFTPKGKVVNLPRGSTPVDFAYRIHTEVGNTCVGAIVNGRIVPLNAPLRNGDILEIITNKKATPRLDWIQFIQTQQAKARIRQWFKKNYREQHETQGRHLLEAELTRAVVEEHMRNGKMLEIAKELNYTNLEDMFLALGFGELNLTRVTNRIKRDEQSARFVGTLRRLPYAKKTEHAPNDILELKGMIHHLAKCCTPVPGEHIIGVVTRSRGVMVHRDDCINLEHVNPDRMMSLTWAGQEEEKLSGKCHSVRLEIHTFDRVGVFKDILTQIADTQTNISNARVKVNPDNTACIEIAVDVSDLVHLERVKKSILKVKDVISVKRQLFRSSRNTATSELDSI